MRNSHKILVGKCEGRRPLGRPRCGLEDNIKMDLNERGYGLDLAGSIQVPVAGCFEHDKEPSDSIKHLEFLE
jgi:hypothetical protein